MTNTLHAGSPLATDTTFISLSELEPPDVAVELDARPFEWRIDGSSPGVSGWGYDGRTPGPVIEAKVGDVVSVRLKNSLPEATTIHWHGLRVPAPMDGTESTQRPVQPGETFEYRFRVPDAGTFWYHPHSNETVQLERGLYGAMVVRADGEPVVDRERILLLDDLRLTRRGDIAPPGGWLERHNGREGAVRLVNGEVEPVITMAAGQIERWRIVNVASARYVRLSVGGREFRIIGTDGGLLEAPVAAREVLLAPADRIDLLVGPFEEGARLSIDSLPYDRGTGRRKVERFAGLLVGPPRPSVARVPERLRTIVPLADAAAPVTRQVRLSGRMSLRRGVDFMIDGERHHRADPVRVGELQVWEIFNDTPIDHPFHLHGFFFQVLTVNGSPPPYRSWEDTVNVPPKGSVRIAWLPDDRPGEWMYHCHILEHHATGMMAHFQVVR
jgi:FtsP/CotA-like multicopper oxidase with cupredoxin domain